MESEELEDKYPFEFEIPNIEKIKEEHLREELWYFAEKHYLHCEIEVRDSSQLQVTANNVDNDLIETLRKYGFLAYSIDATTREDIANEHDIHVSDEYGKDPVVKVIFKKNFAR